MKRRRVAAPIVLLAVLGLACAGQQEWELGAEHTEELEEEDYGEIVAVEEVELEATDRYGRALVGSSLAALAGSEMGPDAATETAAGLVGAIAGGQAGSKVEEELRDDGYEYQIRLDDGRTVSVIELHEDPIDSGQRVRLVYDEDTVRLEETIRTAVRGE